MTKVKDSGIVCLQKWWMQKVLNYKHSYMYFWQYTYHCSIMKIYQYEIAIMYSALVHS